MQDTGPSIHDVVFDARRQRFSGAIAFGSDPEFEVTVAGHRSWSYRQIANAITSAGRRQDKSLKGA